MATEEETAPRFLGSLFMLPTDKQWPGRDGLGAHGRESIWSERQIAEIDGGAGLF